MSPFNCPSFKLSLPAESLETTTYRFVLPGAGDVRPTIVVNWQEVAESQPLADHVRRQCGLLRKHLAEFKIIEEPHRNGIPNAVSVTFEWGAARRRFRQVQAYLREGARVYCLTATAAAANFADHADQLQQVLASFSTPQQPETAPRGVEVIR